MKHVRKQQGFTIIELVVVILLLGILTATALPRFMDVTDEAHDAVVDGVLAGLSTSSGLYRAQWYAQGQPGNVSDYNLSANSTGYAMGTMAGTISSTICMNIFNSFLQPSGRPTISTIDDLGAIVATNLSVASTDFVTRGTASGHICRYAYTGQFQDAVSLTNPVIEYDADTGEFTLAASEL